MHARAGNMPRRVGNTALISLSTQFQPGITIFSDPPFSFSPQIIRGKRAIPMPSTAA
jgi:hypothetical protein